MRKQTTMGGTVIPIGEGRNGAVATKHRILDAAEALFVEHGFEATSLRSITAAADVNLAAANYHFGSKEELFEAVLTRRLDPMNQRRVALLAALEQEAGDAPVACDRILSALFLPALELARDPARGGSELPPPARPRLCGPGAVHPPFPLRALRGDDRPLQGGVRARASRTCHGASSRGGCTS